MLGAGGVGISIVQGAAIAGASRIIVSDPTESRREQALRFGADIRTEKVSRVDLSARPFGVWVGDPDAAEPTYQGEAIIISTGAQSLMLGEASTMRDYMGGERVTVGVVP